MSLNEQWFGTLRLQIGNPTIYDYFIDEKLFTTKYNAFCFALVYGILHNKKQENKTRTGIIPIVQISDQHIKDVISFCYLILDNGHGTKEIYDNMLAYADGGIVELYKIFKQNKSFTMTNLITESQELWKERVKDLQNINLKKSE